MSNRAVAKLPAPFFDLARTLNSGQVFHWIKCGDGFAGSIGEIPLHVEQRDEMLFVRPANVAVVAADYFALDHPLLEICATFPPDEAMTEATRFCHGLRIIRQPAWECLATFITSSMKQVEHIRQISLALRCNFGARLPFDDAELFSYPSPQKIAEVSEEQLRECKLGYRATNLRATAAMISSGDVNLEQIAHFDDAAALAELCRLPGVGPKIANCVLLFAFGRLRAFPIDVWIERVLRQIYFKRRRATPERLRVFTQTYFGPFGGYAQQYLFHHARTARRVGAVSARL